MQNSKKSSRTLPPAITKAWEIVRFAGWVLYYLAGALLFVVFFPWSLIYLMIRSVRAAEKIAESIGGDEKQ